MYYKSRMLDLVARMPVGERHDAWCFCQCISKPHVIAGWRLLGKPHHSVFVPDETVEPKTIASKGSLIMNDINRRYSRNIMLSSLFYAVVR